jgi:hypothetical protein
MSRLRVIMVFLLGGLLACSLSFGGDDSDSDGGDSPDTTSPNTSNTGGAPSISIREPSDGSQVSVNQPVEIVVASDSTVTGFQLNVNGQVRSTISMPPEQRGPATAILTWTPDRLATYAVEVYALNGRAVSQPAQITLQGVNGPAVSSGDTATTCTARIMVSELNFRDGPSTTSGRLGQFDTGETVQVIGQNTGGTWYQVQRFNNEQGWVINNSQWLATEGQCGALSVTG